MGTFHPEFVSSQFKNELYRRTGDPRPMLGERGNVPPRRRRGLGPRDPAHAARPLAEPTPGRPRPGDRHPAELGVCARARTSSSAPPPLPPGTRTPAIFAPSACSPSRSAPSVPATPRLCAVRSQELSDPLPHLPPRTRLPPRRSSVLPPRGRRTCARGNTGGRPALSRVVRLSPRGSRVRLGCRVK